MSMKNDKRRKGSSFIPIPILDLFMLATFVFAMNADIADKKYEKQYQERFVSATNETQQVSSQLAAKDQEYKLAELAALVSLQSNKLETANAEKQAIENENRRLRNELQNAVSESARCQVSLDDAMNNIARLEEINRKQSERIDNYADREAEYAELDKSHNASSVNEGETKIDVRVFITADSRLFWQNNHEWSSCSFKDGLAEFLKSKSLPEDASVRISFIGFYNCKNREANAIQQLKDKFPEVTTTLRNGSHLVYVLDGNTIYVDTDKTQYQKLHDLLKSLAKEDEMDKCPIKFFLVRPNSNDTIDEKFNEWLKDAYGCDIETEVVRY